MFIFVFTDERHSDFKEVDLGLGKRINFQHFSVYLLENIHAYFEKFLVVEHKVGEFQRGT